MPTHRRIAVLTDLDKAENYLEKGNFDAALLASSTALENAKRILWELDVTDPTYDEWLAVVLLAYAVQVRVVKAENKAT